MDKGEEGCPGPTRGITIIITTSIKWRWLTNASDGTSHQIVAVCVVFCARDNIVDDVRVDLTTMTTSCTVIMHGSVIDNLANSPLCFRGTYNHYSSEGHGTNCTKFQLDKVNQWQPSCVKDFQYAASFQNQSSTKSNRVENWIHILHVLPCKNYGSNWWDVSVKTMFGLRLNPCHTVEGRLQRSEVWK